MIRNFVTRGGKSFRLIPRLLSASHRCAIEILLDRPQGWNPDALEDLYDKLRTTKLRFTIENLKQAHKICYHKALVDIISMIKHAARAESHLLTAEERVQNVFFRIMADYRLNDEQNQWMDRIRQHLITNLSISREDFDQMPVFAREGGWSVVDRAFEDWDQIELESDPEACTFKATIQRLKVHKKAVSTEKTSVPVDREPINAPINDLQQQMLSMIQDNPSVSYDEMTAQLRKDRTTIMRNMRKLREMKIVSRTGSRKTGRWEIIPPQKDH